jgi:hypothetical protein
MDDPHPPPPNNDIGAVCWALSDSGVMLPNTLFSPGMACTHPAEDAREVLGHLQRFTPAMRTELGACELCTHLRTLAEAAAP